MTNSKLILFESTQANFRLSIDTMYEKEKVDGSGKQSTIFINKEKGTGIFRPSCFLVFTYLTDDFATTKGIYTSVPHMYRIRQAFQQAHDILHDPNSFITVEGALAVNPSIEQIVIDNLSVKNNDWIALSLTVGTDEVNNMTFPGIAIQHSKSGGYSSLITANEFDSIYDMIMHLDLVSIENQAVIIELLSRVNVGTTKVAAAPAPAYTTAPRTAAPVRAAAPAPAYNSGYTNYAKPAAAPAPAARQAAAYATSAQAAPQTKSPMPPRPATAPKINMDALKDIQVEDIDIDDTSMVDGIFSSEE